MQGVVFTVFRDVVSNHFSMDVFTNALKVVQPSGSGDYQPDGSYPSEDLLALAVEVSKQTESNLSDLLDIFALRLFKRFMFRYSEYHPVWDNSLDVLSNVGSVIHLEVCKASENAKPPAVKAERVSPDHLRIHYVSHRPMADMAASLIKACGQFFSEPLIVKREDICDKGHDTWFDVQRLPG